MRCASWYPPSPWTVVHCPPHEARLSGFLAVESARALNLHDEQVRLTLAATLEALAEMPGELFPVVYFGPLRGLDPLREAAYAAGSRFSIRVAEWPAADEAGAPGMLLAHWTDLPAADDYARGCPSLQLIGWGELPASELPRECRAVVLDGAALAIAPAEIDGVPGEGSWLGRSLERIAAGGGSAGNPLVIVTEADTIRTRADEVQMHFEAAGAVAEDQDWERTSSRADGIAVVVAANADDETIRSVVSLAAACRAEERPCVIVATDEAWEAFRSHREWKERVVTCTVFISDAPSPGAASSLPWPALEAVWVGGPPLTREGEAPIVLPEGTGLLEGLGHVELRGRGRLVAWCCDRVAVVHVESRVAGSMVVDAIRAGAEDRRPDRGAVLEVLDEVRRWQELRLAVLPAGDARDTGVAETIQRIGFHFSRMDDEGRAALGPGDGECERYEAAWILAELGLATAAEAVLRRAERDSRWGPREEILLARLLAGSDPEESVERLRAAALRVRDSSAADAWQVQTDATLNALLLMVRRGQVGGVDAWRSVGAWLEQAGTVWGRTARHAAVLFELSYRAGKPAESAQFADLFRAVAESHDPLWIVMAPLFESLTETIG